MICICRHTQLQPPGTLYVVVECIMMEGTDVDLYPGDTVELVRMEPATGSLRVRTLDEHHPIEGMIPESYLRRKDSMLQQGGKMESELLGIELTFRLLP